MPKNQDSLFRQWHMLRFVPRHPRKITVRAIQSQLSLEGFEVSDRTVQRDLMELSEVFPLVVDDREKPFGWSWHKDAKAFDLPGLSVAEALTWVLAEQHLGQLLPRSLLDHLGPHFRAARERLDKEAQPQHGRNWLNKVRTVPPVQPLIPPNIDPEVQRTISDAVLQERQIEIRYRTKGKAEATLYQVHPLAIVQRGHVVYLYGRLFDYPNTRILAMHRIESASLLDLPAVAPDGFDLDDKVAKGVWSFGAADTFTIQLKFFDGKGEHLLETPLSTDQRVETVADDPKTLLISASVIDTPQLRWWLLGFGAGVEVLTPASLRNELSETAQRMVVRYATAV
ncbi:MAG: WYL domain-containing protein [Zoogloea sp.]|nr:WYL domain-containing protein [Zoogloea sp.]